MNDTFLKYFVDIKLIIFIIFIDEECSDDFKNNFLYFQIFIDKGEGYSSSFSNILFSIESPSKLSI